MANQLSRTVLLGRKEDQDSNGKSCPKRQKPVLLKRRIPTRAAARAPHPFPFVPSPLSPPFVLIHLILTSAPPPDGGSLIIADVSYLSPLLVRSLRFISPHKKSGGIWPISQLITNAPWIISVPNLGIECDRTAGEGFWCCQFASKVKFTLPNTKGSRYKKKSVIFFSFFSFSHADLFFV